MKTNDNTSLHRRALQSTAQFLIALLVVLLLPALTLRYWQAWLYWVLFSTLTVWISLYFLKHDPALVERRMAAGPAAETEKSQKIIMTVASSCIVLLFAAPGIDHVLRGSSMPPASALLADMGFVIGYLIIFSVLKENSYAGATVGDICRAAGHFDRALCHHAAPDVFPRFGDV